MDNGKEILAHYCHIVNRRGTSPLAISPIDSLRIFAGSVFGMGIIAYLAMSAELMVMIASFGASACLIFYVPAGPFSQPRNVIGGHVIAAAIGVAAVSALGCTWFAAALSVGGAIVAMLHTRTMHPPAAATALIAVTSNQGPLFPLLPVAAGATILMLTGVLVNRLVPQALAVLSSRTGKSTGSSAKECGETTKQT